MEFKNKLASLYDELKIKENELKDLTLKIKNTKIAINTINYDIDKIKNNIEYDNMNFSEEEQKLIKQLEYDDIKYISKIKSLNNNWNLIKINSKNNFTFEFLFIDKNMIEYKCNYMSYP